MPEETQNPGKPQLLAKVAELEAELAGLKKRKKFGLVWEDKPEHAVTRCQRELPVLREVKGLGIAGDAELPTNLLIEGDNYHALSVLNYTHQGKIDVIYIDPPYNTGARDWKYNNDYVDAIDGYRHSKWLSMMANRLRLAKRLLSDKGIICVAIDHNELFTLGCLMDEIFGENNRLGVIAVRHHPRGRTQSDFFSTVHEYALYYAFNRGNIKGMRDFRFAVNTEPEWISFVRSRLDSTPESRPNLFYPIYYDAKTKEIGLDKTNANCVKIMPASNNGMRTWQLVQDRFLAELAEGKIKVSKARGQYRVSRLVVREKYKAESLWVDPKYDANPHGDKLIKKIFDGEALFNFPKSVYNVMDTIKLTSDKDSVVLDFFAGSGTTGHAVALLNKADGGARRFILCTNNEGGIAREVCRPRIKAVFDGHPKLPDITGMGGNLKYFQTDFVPAARTDQNKLKLTERAAAMLCVREDTFTKVKETAAYKLFRNARRYTGIVYDSAAIHSFKRVIAKLDGDFTVYVFSLGGDDFADEFAELPRVQTRPIPESILQSYRRLFGAKR